MSVVSVRLSNEENELFRSYCAIRGISISEAFKMVLFEKIEDEFDVIKFEEAEKSFEKNPIAHSLEELRKTYNL
jgi:hypothetical protein